MKTKLKEVSAWTVFLVALAFLLARIPLNTVSIANAQSGLNSEQSGTNTVATITPFLVQPSKLGGKPVIPVYVPKGIPAKQAKILGDLLKCESGANALAYNKVDRDGTPSYGALQFKPSTYYTVLKQYLYPNITPEEAYSRIYDGELQVKVFLLWYGDYRPISWWQNQFPDCSMKHNYWQ